MPFQKGHKINVGRKFPPQCGFQKGHPPHKPEKYKDVKCSIKECNKPAKAKGFCKLHYDRFHRYGNPLIQKKCGFPSKGLAEYPNHYEMKRNRLIVLERANWECELCGKPVNRIHHKDNSKDNHKLDNLVAVCNKCHGILHTGRNNKTSKYIRKYGMTLKEMGKKVGKSECWVWKQLKKKRSPRQILSDIMIAD